MYWRCCYSSGAFGPAAWRDDMLWEMQREGDPAPSAWVHRFRPRECPGPDRLNPFLVRLGADAKAPREQPGTGTDAKPLRAGAGPARAIRFFSGCWAILGGELWPTRWFGFLEFGLSGSCLNGLLKATRPPTIPTPTRFGSRLGGAGGWSFAVSLVGSLDRPYPWWAWPSYPSGLIKRKSEVNDERAETG